MITQADIDANQPVVVKWDKPLANNGAVTDGVLAGQANEFITRIENESQLLGMARYIKMEGETQDIQTLRVKATLQNTEKLSGNVGALVDTITSLTETAPGILKEALEAKMFTAYTLIAKPFLKTNIEKEGFIAKYESLLAPAVAYDAEKIAIFGKVPASGQTSSGYEAIDGLLAQLDAVAADYLDTTTHLPKSATKPQGRFGTHWDSTESAVAYTDLNAGEGYKVIPQIQAMVKQYIKQKGKRSLVKIFVSNVLSATIIDEAALRETEGGDRLLFNDNGNLLLKGIEVIPLDALDDPENSYGEVILIANPDSIAYGPVMEAESEAQYKVELKKYLTSIDWMFDVGIIFAEDLLYAKVDYTAKPSN